MEGTPEQKEKYLPRLASGISEVFPPRGGGEKFLSQLKNGEEFEGGLEKRKGKGEKRRKKEKSDKIHVKIPL